MPAGRPRKYHTEEDKALAHRGASARHYERNRKVISARRKTKRDADRKQNQSKDSETQAPPKPQTVQAKVNQPDQSHDFELLESRVCSLERRLAKIVGTKSNYVLVFDICTEFEDLMRDGCDTAIALEVFTDSVEELTKLENAATSYHTMAVKCVDVNPKLVLRVRAALTRAQTLRTNLDELLTKAVMGPDAFLDDFRQGTLEFQIAFKERAGL
ncbi:hypothetical protein NMY22_g18373 [Coprinellus aureogranulatus]|nr:hypothetical protein NMY22_g18373 [Coprinellus aureogranulatus]